MSGAKVSNTETYTIFVRLLDEGIDVWRPVKARKVSEEIFQLESQEVPEDESWEFSPGQIVTGELRTEADGIAFFANAAVEVG